MIKKVLAIILSFLYLVISIGFPISIHHCHGQNEISIAFADEAKCSCADLQNETESCCSIDLIDLQPCQTDLHLTDCCTHETKVVHFDLKQQLVKKQNNEIQVVEIDLFNSALLLDIVIEEETNKLKADFLSDPPPKPIPLQVLNQEFIFYG
jgi:hypothetical protein